MVKAPAFERANGEIIDFSQKVFVMGIVNVTPDSFYRGSRATDTDEALRKALCMIEEGADILDIGGESTRPGAEPVNEEEEMRRVIPVIKSLRKEWDGIISIDTYKASVAEEAIKAGADMVNDIGGLHFDREMVRVVVEYKVPVVIMHSSGKPDVMMKRTEYNNLLEDIKHYIKESIDALLSYGYPESRIVVDPGIGFGKKTEQNLKIIANLDYFKSLERPILIGPSRKSFIGMLSGGIPPEERLPGSLSSIAISVIKGANIIRTHDVGETVQAVNVAFHIMKNLENNDKVMGEL